MNKAEKAIEVKTLKQCFVESQLTVLADYKGLSVAEMTDLRRQLRAQSSTLKVVKNRLAKIALQDTPLAQVLTGHFVGTTAVATTVKDTTGPAKVIAKFIKDNEKLKVKIGFFGGKELDEKGLKALASLPSREELIAKMLGSLLAPATNLACVLVQIPRQLVTALSAIKEQKAKQAT